MIATRGPPGTSSCGRKWRPSCGSTPRNVKKCAATEADLHDLRVRIAAEDHLLAGGDRQLLERLAAIAIVAVVERVHGRQILRAVAEHVPQHGQAFGRSVRQRPEQHAVHHAEERGAGTDAERERRDGQSQEALAARQRSECESKVLNHGDSNAASTWRRAMLEERPGVPHYSRR